MIGVKINFGSGGGSGQQEVYTFDDISAFPIVGASNTIYIANDTSKAYTWNGSTYVSVNPDVPKEVVNFPDLASFPDPGTVDTIYIADDTGFGYTWDGVQYIALNNSGIFGLGTPNFLPKFTAPNTIGNSKIIEYPLLGSINIRKGTVIGNMTNEVGNASNSFLRLWRQQNVIDFISGNHQIGQIHKIQSTNALGFALDCLGYWSIITNNIERARFLAANGFLGLNTTTPTEVLDVNGSVRLRAALKDNNNTPGTIGQVLKSNGNGVKWGDSSDAPIAYLQLRLYAKGIQAGVPNIDVVLEVNDLVKGFKDEFTFWESAQYLGGDPTDRANYKPIIETEL